jgi:uncharacterized SAM-binding protein YcdF (DUF218 family)
MFFILSKILHFFVMPSFWFFTFLVLIFVVRNAKLKRLFKILTVSVAIVFSNTFLFKEFVRMWEVHGVHFDEVENHDVAIVLGGMAEYNNDIKRLSLRGGGDRIWQAIGLYKRGKVKKLLISGESGYVFGRGLRESVQMKNELVMWGIPSEDILIDSLSRNSYENAIESYKVIRTHFPDNPKTILVTSSVHMKRAKSCFDKLGYQVTPFTTNHYTGPKRHYHWDEYIIPSLQTALMWEGLTHEWVGYLVYRIQGYGI